MTLKNNNSKKQRKKTVAIIGGGIQGCLVALEMIALGHKAVLFEATESLINLASRWNEGKLHLGFTYSNDPSLRSAQTMIKGSFLFLERIKYLTGKDLSKSAFSNPFTYLVDSKSLLNPVQIEKHFSACDNLIRNQFTNGGYYHGYEGGPTYQILNKDEIMQVAGNWCIGAFRTMEVSLDPHEVGKIITDTLLSSDIEIYLNTRINTIEEKKNSYAIHTNRNSYGPFDCVINAAWHDRLRLDSTTGIFPQKEFLHRYKVAIHYRGALNKSLPSVTLVLGPYGDVVSFNDRSYLSWYPICKLGSTSELSPPDYGKLLTNENRSIILRKVVNELSSRLPDVANAAEKLNDINQVDIEGGYIFAWGNKDVDVIDTKLHERHEIGIHRKNKYYSIDTGKYCLAALNSMDISNILI